jgi:hypothetical protein
MMSKTSKWFTGIAAVILCLALLALAGVWRLGLLPLLLPPPLPLQPQISQGEIVQPSGEIYLSKPGSTSTNSQPEDLSNLYPGTIPGGSKTAPDSPAPDAWTSKSQLQQEIEGQYINRLESLSKSYEDRLNTLEGEAYNDYITDKKQGHPVSAMVLAGKYIPMGNALEQQCDDQFYALLNQFKTVLQNNGLPQSTAIRAQQVYEYDKAIRKKAILTAAARMI